MAGIIDSGSTTRILNTINRNQEGLLTRLSQLASGNRLVNASVDAAGLAISEGLRSDIAALSQSVRNIETGGNFIRVAEGGLSTISDLIGRGRELAIQAANGTLGDAERETINAEFSQILTEIDRVSGTQEFNGQNILDGNLAPNSPNQVDIQVGIESGPENQINLNVIDETSTQSLGIDNLDVLTSQNALQAFDQLGQAQQTVINTRGEVGALSNRLEITSRNTRNTLVNLESSRNEIAGTDIAAGISELNNSLLRIESSVRALALQTQSNESNIGRLLNINT
ncbi:MAG: flagellin FliC [Candidatus Nitronauta litoralis]|uniref:Flagellin n=1 Tax=Candidatus Nitronauta litoralis TaxID=2705533 RepID=A0A7T0FZ66_9BACT|nr:MAG: flagellin FliC [Candidatus Nitronauta litoralis]